MDLGVISDSLISHLAGIPPYQSMLSAYHKAFEPDLLKAIEALPLCKGDHVLDVGCGDGTFSMWLAARVAPDGYVTGMDESKSYLAMAQRTVAHSPHADRISFKQGTVQKLPFETNSFDFVWCAQSLFSFPDPLDAVREMTRVARPNGVVAILEDDTLHQILIPWPVELELAVRTAEWKAFCHENIDPKKYYIARGLRALFDKSGLRPQAPQILTFYRESPLTTMEEKFISKYLTNLSTRVREWLEPNQIRTLDELIDPRSPHYLPAQPSFTMTYLEKIVWGKKK